MSDILLKTDDYVFSYRAAGICIQNGMVLLQKYLAVLDTDPRYAIAEYVVLRFE